MKNLKKLASLLLALILTLSMTVSVAEESQSAQEGSITINGVTANGTYEIYKLLKLESYNPTTGAYSYTVEDAWKEFFTSKEAKDYVTVDANGYVNWTGSEADSDVAAFATSALAYAKAKPIAPVQSSATPGDFVITGTAGKFDELPLGYYLIDSSMGALCGLTTTNPNASINAKNGTPTVDKQVLEDSTNQWGDKNTADVGQTVEFRTTINVAPGAQNYVLHDKMSEGLTFGAVTKVEHVIPGKETHETSTDKYTVQAPGEDGCTFDVIFSADFVKQMTPNDKIIVYYTAVVNEKAIVAGNGNPNEAWLDYGENNESNHDQTQTFTYGFDIVKSDSQNKLLDGAEFKIYDAETGGNEVPVVKVSDNLYRRAKTGEEGETIVVTGGKVRVEGFDNGTYYLEETKAPEGYNKITVRQKFIIQDGNLDAIFNDGIYSTGSGVHVVNKTGSVLPETGGIGTTLFYVLGGLLVAGAVVLLITRKRMGEV